MLNLLKFVSVFSFESNWSGGKGNGAPTLGTKRRCEQLLAWVLEKDNDKSQLSRWSCWKDNIHEEEKCMSEKHPFPGPGQRAQEKLQNRPFYNRTLKGNLQFSHLNVFPSFLRPCFWLKILTKEQPKSKPSTGRSSAGASNDWPRYFKRGTDKSQLSRGSCWKDNIHEEEKCLSEKHPFPGPGQRAQKKLQNRPFYNRTLKGNLQFSHLNVFPSFLRPCFWLNILTKEQPKSKPSRGRSSADASNDWPRYFKRGTDKSQLSRGSCWKDNIHEEQKCLSEKHPFPRPGQRERKKSFKIVRFTIGRLKAICNFLISMFFLLFCGPVFG